MRDLPFQRVSCSCHQLIPLRLLVTGGREHRTVVCSPPSAAVRSLCKALQNRGAGRIA